MPVPEVDFFTFRFLYVISTWIWDDQGSKINDCGLLVYEAMYIYLWNAYDIGVSVKKCEEPVVQIDNKALLQKAFMVSMPVKRVGRWFAAQQN